MRILTLKAVWLLSLLAGSGPVSLLACGGGAESQTETPTVVYRAPTPKPGEREVAILTVRDLGEIRFELLADAAPATVTNFKKLAAEGLYDGTTFHRVISEFMIQGGDPNSKNRDPRDDGKGGPGYFIDDEFNETSHARGVVSMANVGRKNSAGSQFFIMHQDFSDIDGSYTAFGVVTEGLNVVDAVAAVKVDRYGRHGPKDRPLENVVVESVRIELGDGTPWQAEAGALANAQPEPPALATDPAGTQAPR